MASHTPSERYKALVMIAKPATIEDVATLAGVSIATVSRALHKPNMVSERTRERVAEAVDATGYTQNVMARNLRTKQTRMIVVLVPDIGNLFFSETLSGIESVAAERGYNILIGNTNNDLARERTFASYVRSNQADGLLLLNGRVPFNPVPPGNHASDLPPMVAVCERIPGSDLPTVCIDNVEGAFKATQHLLDLGHTRIAHIKGPEDNILTTDRLAGFRAAHKAANVAVDEALIVDGDFSISSGRNATLRALEAGTMPTGFICANDEMAMGAIQALKGEGYSVPRDISVVGFDDIQFSEAYDPPLTTIHQPRHRLGEEAMRVMLDQLETGTAPRKMIILETDLVVRASTAHPGVAR